ncbi:flagellar hook-basal body complex protein [Aeoliella sp.]|uniref:flagellar hook-basal body complex protein n=1 Tax=Aeoliella sp. TaxID=2795800 RepID=UPI003CCB7E50
MGLQSALTTALTGLQAAETTIDVVGNNVANSSTVGFKESEAVFATQFLQTVSIGGAPTSNSGGTNPRQIGLGVKVAAITPNFSQGTIEISSNPLDLAIQGDGFLMVQSGTGRLYTRNGQLQLNANNEIVTTTGQRVLGYGVDDEFNLVESGAQPLTIPLGQQRVAQATENAFFTGVLNPAVQEGTQPEVVESVVLGDGSYIVPDDTNFSSADIVESTIPAGATTNVTGAGTGPGNVATGTVRYRWTFRDGNLQESTPSAEITAAADGSVIDIENLPDATGIWQDRILYRTEPDGNTFYQVGSMGASGATYSDISVDGANTGNLELDDDLLDAGSYNYYVTFYDSSPGLELETQPTGRIGPVSVTEVTGGRLRLDLGDIPAPTDARFDTIRIYRTTEAGSTYHLAGEIAAPVGDPHTTSFIDTTTNTDLASQPELDINGPVVGSGTLLTDVVVREGDTITQPFELGRLSFSAEKDGVTLEPKFLDIEADTTVGELMLFMQDAMGLDQSSSDITNPFPNPQAGVTLVNGQLVVTSNYGEENAISIPLSGLKLIPTGEVTSQSVTLNFGSTQSADGPGTSTEFVVYDSLGLPLSVRVTTVLETKEANSTTYRWYATSADNEPSDGQTTVIGDGLLVFDQNGDLDANTNAQISVLRNDTASESPLEITLDYSAVKSLGEVDALGNNISSLNVSSQDGFPPGVMTDFIISEDGLIQGQFSNGTQRTVGQLLMARFTNNAGLRQVGDSLFGIGVNSGEPIVGRPGEDGIGTLTAGAVELSNTDIGQNLIELILASTQYRGGARVISASQELLDELLALRR